MTELIMHRRPEKMDEDWNGEVLMLRFPDGGVSSRGETYALVAAAHVGPGVPWKRTDIWQPRATPGPEPTARKVPRLFAEPPRRTFSPSGAPQWDALADDGTAWKWSGTLEEWDQHQPLPDREEPIDSEPADGPQWGTVAG
jgi:hypothetical protein